MDISTLTDSEKTLMLAKVMGWRVCLGGEHIPIDIDENKTLYLRPGNTLYTISNMFLAWLVLSWAHENLETRYADGVGHFIEFWLPPEQAQRVWLDKVLELALDAGLVEVK